MRIECFRGICLAASAAIGFSVISSGCGKAAAPKTAEDLNNERMEQEMRLEQEVDALFASIQSAVDANQMDEALKLADKGIADARYKTQRGRLIEKKVELLFRSGRKDEAQKAVLDGWRSAPEEISAAHDTLARLYQASRDYAGLAAWCRKMREPASPVPQARREQIFGWQLGAANSARDGAMAKDALADIMRDLPTDKASKIISDALRPLCGQPSGAAFITPILQTLAPSATGLCKPLLPELALQGLLTQKKWAEAMKSFTDGMDALDDADLFKSSRMLFTSLRSGGETNLLEKATERVVFQATGKNRSVTLAARYWIDCCEARKDGALHSRLNALLLAKLPPNQVGNLYDKYFYSDIENKPMVKGLVDLGNRLIPLCSDTNTVNSIKIKLLEGAFLLDDYAAAVKMLEAGIPGKDAKWHAMSLPKVRAHYFLQLADAAKAKGDAAAEKDNALDAIKNFRTFMAKFKECNEEEEYDPTTGIAYSSEWVLGRNAKRISDIYRNYARDKASAEKAFAEAKELYRVALDKAKDDAKAMAVLANEAAPFGLKPEAPKPAAKK